jgi:hypothetical protein
MSDHITTLLVVASLAVVQTSKIARKEGVRRAQWLGSKFAVSHTQFKGSQTQ